MDPITGLVGASIIAPIIGGIMGNEAAKGNRDAAQQAAAQAYQELLKLGTPPDLSQQIILEQFKKAGVYTPTLEQDISAGVSKVSQIQDNGSAKDAQMQGLNLLKERATQGGLNATDRANFNQIRQQADIDQQGKLEAIKQNMAARGMGGSGAELAQQLGAASAAGANESASSDRLAAQAQQAALQSALQSGQLGGQIRQQDFDINNTKAAAADRFKMFDTQNSIARQQRNVGSQNQGQMYNLNEQQNINNMNTQNANAEAQREAAAKRQYWQDQAQLANMKAGARLGQSNQLNQQATAQAQQWQGIGSGVGNATGSLANAYASGALRQKTPGSGIAANAPDQYSGDLPATNTEFDPNKLTS